MRDTKENIVLNDMRYRLKVLLDDLDWYYKRTKEFEEKVISLKECIAEMEHFENAQNGSIKSNT